MQKGLTHISNVSDLFAFFGFLIKKSRSAFHFDVWIKIADHPKQATVKNLVAGKAI